MNSSGNSSRLSAVVCVSECGELLPGAIESLERQTVRPGDIVLVAGADADARVQRSLRDLSARPDVRAVVASGSTAGARRNAGLKQSAGEYVVLVNEGDLLDRTFCERALEAFDNDATIAAVCAWTSMQAADGPVEWRALSSLDARGLVLRPQSAPESGMIRRKLWVDLGEFDESLPALDLYDFWLAAAASGARVDVIESPLVHRTIRRTSAFRRSLDEDRYATAMRVIVEKRRGLFDADPGAVLFERERTLTELVRTHRNLVERRDRTKSTLDDLEARIRELREYLGARGSGGIDWGDLRRTDPVDRNWGYERGTPVDRHYIERFLETHASDIRGRVLEVQESDLTVRYGGGRVEHVDVVDFNPANPGATIIADLRDARAIASNTFDCFVLTQTIHVIDDMPAVAAECFRILKPGGVLLVTLPCASRVCLEYGENGDFWRVTEAGARALFSKVFPPDHLEVRAYGNVLVNTAFLYGLGSHELTQAEFDVHDPYYPMLIGVRAVKPDETASQERLPAKRRGASAGGAGAVLLYHRVGTPPSDFHELSIDAGLFREQMAHLARDYTPMSLSDLIAAAREDAVPSRAVAVTFDDGYLDNLAHAAPILAKLGIPATFFVTTAGIEDGREYWWDTLERIFVGIHPLPDSLDISVGGHSLRLDTRSADERRIAHAALHGKLVRASLEERDAVVAAMLRWSGFDDSPLGDARPMRAHELRALARVPGVTVGFHGVHHLALGFQDVAVQRDEIVHGKRALDALLGPPTTLFAYPYGHFDETSVSLVREAGYDAAVTCEVGLVRADSDRALLPRFEAKAWNSAEFATRIRALFAAGPKTATSEN